MEYDHFSLWIRGAELSGKAVLWRVAPSSLDATIVVGQKPGVEVEQRLLEDIPGKAAIAPFSVSIYELQVGK
jgi:hypothetical protein